MLHVPDTSEHVPTLDDPFLKVTVPDAVDGETVPVKVTAEPNCGDRELDVNTVDVASEATVTVVALVVAGPYDESPL